MYACMSFLVDGFVDLWIYGCMDVCIVVLVYLHSYGFIDLWMSGVWDLRISRSVDL